MIKYTHHNPIILRQVFERLGSLDSCENTIDRGNDVCPTNMGGKLASKIAVACLLYCIIGCVGAAHCELKTRNGETSCGGTLKSFVEKTGAENPFASALSSSNHFSSKANLKTAFHDWDNDGRIDLLLGSTQNLTYFKNTASGFVQQTTSATDPFHAVDVHADAATLLTLRVPNK